MLTFIQTSDVDVELTKKHIVFLVIKDMHWKLELVFLRARLVVGD